jgi:hypothetical protein
VRAVPEPLMGKEPPAPPCLRSSPGCCLLCFCNSLQELACEVRLGAGQGQETGGYVTRQAGRPADVEVLAGLPESSTWEGRICVCWSQTCEAVLQARSWTAKAHCGRVADCCVLSCARAGLPACLLVNWLGTLWIGDSEQPAGLVSWVQGSSREPLLWLWANVVTDLQEAGDSGLHCCLGKGAAVGGRRC